MPQFKVGDRVYHKSRQVYGEVRHLHDLPNLYYVYYDSYGMVVSHRHLLILESVYNSPLYKALK